MDEHITKAQQTADLLHADIFGALRAAHGVQRPEGKNRADRIAEAYLTECLQLANQLKAKLAAIGD